MFTYLIIGVLIAIVTSLGAVYYYDKYKATKIKVVQISSILDNKEETLELLKKKQITKEQYLQLLRNRTKLLSTAIKELTKPNDVVLLKDFVIMNSDNNIKDITKEVKEYVKKHSIIIKK